MIRTLFLILAVVCFSVAFMKGLKIKHFVYMLLCGALWTITAFCVLGGVVPTSNGCIVSNVIFLIIALLCSILAVFIRDKIRIQGTQDRKQSSSCAVQGDAETAARETK
jgi:uncharacterized membrane protein